MMQMVNHDYVEDDRELRDGDEVAFIPPVSGGTEPKLFAMTTAHLDPREVEELVAQTMLARL
jgi:hypothetical protein